MKVEDLDCSAEGQKVSDCSAEGQKVSDCWVVSNLVECPFVRLDKTLQRY